MEQTIMIKPNMEYHDIFSKKYKTVIFCEEYHSNDQANNEQIRIENDKLRVYAVQDSTFYNYFMKNIPRCNKLSIKSWKGNYPDASLFTKVNKLELACFMGAKVITPEYLASLKDIPIIKGVYYLPEYKDIDFTNIYCEFSNIRDIPTSVKYIKIYRETHSLDYIGELYDRLQDFYQLEQIVISFIPTPRDLELLTKMPIKSFQLVDLFADEDISYVISANLFEKIKTPKCSFSLDSLEDNYVMTKFIVNSNTYPYDEKKKEFIASILERNKQCKSDARFFKTKALIPS